MTCQEFRRLNVTDEALYAMTVAERAACSGHYNGCRWCRRWIDREAKKVGPQTPAEREAIVRSVLDVILSDLQDPEAH